MALQPLEPTTIYVDRARDYAAHHRVPVPTYGPAATVFYTLVAHAEVVHPDHDLADYLDLYR